MEGGYRRIIKVNADHFPDGSCRPNTITIDDETFPVDRVIRSERMASLKVGSTGIRYTVRITGRLAYLFDLDNGRWCVEVSD